MLLFGTFLVGIAQFLWEHQVVIDGVKLISYSEGYLLTLLRSGSVIIIGCIVGLLGSFLPIFLNKYSLKNYIINAFLIDAFLSILYGILSFVTSVVSGQEWLIAFISATSIYYCCFFSNIISFYFNNSNAKTLFINRDIIKKYKNIDKKSPTSVIKLILNKSFNITL